uniref:SAM domain-containing protein n=2 Tax=Ciona intestinalis TaxID=7719 RepID=F6XYK4_CIOIN
MDVINVSYWKNHQVVIWFKGLDECLQIYLPNIIEANVVGEQLLSLSHDDLHNLQIHYIGHQELIFNAVSLLQKLDDGLATETLQTRALCLNCRCRSLRSTIVNRRQEVEDYEYDGGVSLHRGPTNQLLRLAANVLDEGKQLVLWLDRVPFTYKPEFRSIRDNLVRLCYELSTTMQHSVFACVIEEAVLGICSEMEIASDSISRSNNSLTITPVSMEIVTLNNIN